MTNTAQAPKAATKKKRRSEWPRRLVPILMILAGIVVLLYPVGATYYNNYKQAEFAYKYNSQAQQVPPHKRSEAIDRARAYNAKLGETALMDPWSGGDMSTNPGYQDYLHQLNDQDAMARLRIPNIKVDQAIYHGTTDATLARGVGHLYGTALPVGGDNTHSVLTAHSGMANATMFDRVHELKEGDTLFIDVYGETLAYQVDQIQIVLPSEIDKLVMQPGRDIVTLVTCTPYAVNTHRLLVTGHRVPYDPAKDSAKTPISSMDWTIQPWMRDRFIGAAAALGFLLIMMTGWIISDAKARRRRARKAAEKASQTALEADQAE